MNMASAQADSTSERAAVKWPWVLLALVACAAAITQQSLWNDEALTAIKAMQPNLSGWWHEMVADKASDLQMPLYMFYMWAFAKVFGASEIALRAANIPWFVVGFAALVTTLSGPKKIAVAIASLLSPFAWYYLSEARPYAMQLGAGLMIFAALYRFQKTESLSPRQERCWLALFLFGVIALSGSSLLGMVWAGAACLAALWIWSQKRSDSVEFGVPPLGGPDRVNAELRTTKLVHRHPVLFLLSLTLLAATALYYSWTLKQGARASDVGRTDARNLFFIAYELLGFGGLGPGRLEIRNGGLAAFVPFSKLFVIYGVLVGDLLILGIWQLSRSQKRKNFLAISAIIVLPMAIILGTGCVKEFRVLGRHFTPLMPVLLFVLGLGLQARWSRRHWISKPLTIAFVMMTIFSCLSFRFATRHERDDYRGAAAIAKAGLQAHETVWWNAGREGALYYDIPLGATPGSSDHAILLMNPTPEMLSNSPPPAFIIASKPDVYDGFGAIAGFLAQGGYVKFDILPAFTIWHSGDLEVKPLPPKLVREFD